MQQQRPNEMKRNLEPITVYVEHEPFRVGSRGPQFVFWCPEFPAVMGNSTEPLLDACRMIVGQSADRKRRVNLVDDETGMIRLTGIAGKAARLRIMEGQTQSPRFAKWVPHDQRGYPTR